MVCVKHVQCSSLQKAVQHEKVGCSGLPSVFLAPASTTSWPTGPRSTIMTNFSALNHMTSQFKKVSASGYFAA